MTTQTTTSTRCTEQGAIDGLAAEMEHFQAIALYSRDPREATEARIIVESRADSIMARQRTQRAEAHPRLRVPRSRRHGRPRPIVRKAKSGRPRWSG